MKRDIVIIGGGPAGLAAAVSAYDAGIEDVLIIEREGALGGILNQCIHNGFGLTRFKENMTGPEYAERFILEVKKRGIEVMPDTTVLDITGGRLVTAISPVKGVFAVEAKAVILAMGCRERSKGALNIAGSRPSGLMSAGTAQKYINIKGYAVGREAVILGSGDIGLIMARRMTLEGAKVHAVLEIMPYSGGLRRNIVQCLDDFNIPLLLSHTIVNIHGHGRVEGVTVAAVDSAKRPIKKSQRYIACDTVLFSVGLIPENELTLKAGVKLNARTKGAVVDGDRQTNIPGIFACGNVLHVHDLVDFVSEEAEIAGRGAAEFIKNGGNGGGYEKFAVEAGSGVSYVLPQTLDCKINAPVKLFFRPSKVYKNVTVELRCKDSLLISKKKAALAPGEMETLTLTPKHLAGIDAPLTLSISGEE